jgi:hypothetical protein
MLSALRQHAHIVVSPEEPAGNALLLEPNGNPIAKTYQEALYQAGLPPIVFGVQDIHKEHERLKQLGVVFRQVDPRAAEPVPNDPASLPIAMGELCDADCTSATTTSRSSLGATAKRIASADRSQRQRPPTGGLPTDRPSTWLLTVLRAASLRRRNGVLPR